MPGPWLPEGWFYTVTPAAGAQAQIVVPAGAGGLTRVLTSITAGLQSAVAGNYGAFLQVLDGVTVVAQWAMAFSVAAGTFGEDRQDFDVTIPATSGNTLTVQFSVGIANVIEQLMIKGYDL